MTSDYRANLYRVVFSLAAIYNIAFGLWACAWPRSFFDSVEIAPPNYPALWSCLGMVVGLYGVLYAYAAYRIDCAAPIISVGLAGKILGPIGWLMVINSGEWPVRTFTLIVFNDLIWWLPFGLFLLDETPTGRWLRRITPWACAAANALAALVMLFALRGGTEAISSFAERATYIAKHAVLWRTGWAIWMAAAVSLVAFFAWWGAWIRSTRWGIVACVVAILGLACDLLAESLFIGWLPARIETLAPAGSLLTGSAANGLYTIAGVILTLGTPSLHGVLRVWAWAIWTSGIALTVCTMIGSVTGMVISTTALMLLLCPWVAVFGWKLQHECHQAAAA